MSNPDPKPASARPSNAGRYLFLVILGLVVGAVKVFVNFNRNFHRQGLSVIIDGDFHLPFLRSDFCWKI